MADERAEAIRKAAEVAKSSIPGATGVLLIATFTDGNLLNIMDGGHAPIDPKEIYRHMIRFYEEQTKQNANKH